MPHPKPSLIVCWAERITLFALILFFCLHTLPRAWKSLVTDFPNYYLAAQLAQQGFETSRMYEWQWLEREKDHRAIPIRVIGLVPITPFSTLFMAPLTALKPVAAKRIWITMSLALLFPISWMLRIMTGLSYQRIALLFALNFPLYRNLEFGQFYVVLLLLIIAACLAWLRGRHGLAGALVAIAAASKIFPALFFIFFLQRRAWRAFISGTLVVVAAIVLSVAVFGWNVHRTYLQEILPWTLHGETMPPYVTNASISGILHVLFLAEPEWNPNPWHPSVLIFSLLFPLMQMFVLAPAILLIRREDTSPDRSLLEWSALLTASLAVSTIPASYNFVLMAFPMCVLSAELLERKRFGWLVALIAAYIGIGLPVPIPSKVPGLAILLYTPRLPLMIAVLIGIYFLLLSEPSIKEHSRDWTRLGWAVAMIICVAFTARSTFLRESGERQEYAYRMPLEPQGYINANPQSNSTAIRYITFTLDGYHLTLPNQNSTAADPAPATLEDDLSFAINSDHLLVERAEGPTSEIVDLKDALRVIVRDARDPMIAADGQSLAFLRDDHGQGHLMLRAGIRSSSPADLVLTPPSLDVYEASFLSASNYAFAASNSGQPPQIYLTDATRANAQLALGESRYPALSPDGAWLAYSHFEDGVWNLWIRDQKTGMTRRVGRAPCNEIEPSWESDSKTLLYSTDCGRSLWFTAVAQRRVIP